MSADLIERLRSQRTLEAHRTTAADTVAERTSAGYREQLLFDTINALAAKDAALSEMRAERDDAIATVKLLQQQFKLQNDHDTEQLERARKALAEMRFSLELFARHLRGKSIISRSGYSIHISERDYAKIVAPLASQDEGEERT